MPSLKINISHVYLRYAWEIIKTLSACVLVFAAVAVCAWIFTIQHDLCFLPSLP